MLSILLGLVLAGDVWLWLRLDTAVERLVSGCLLSALLALWYHTLTRRHTHPWG
jgi:hypothetical protein